MRRRRKVMHQIGPDGLVDLNVMPFIDIFSLLCTFLLFSAVFVSIGIHEVQIPFLSNAATPAPPPGPPPRSLSVNIEMGKDSLILKSKWSSPPVNAVTKKFDASDQGIAELHTALEVLKSQDEKADKATLFVSDDVNYQRLIMVLDAIKLGGNIAASKVESESNGPNGPKQNFLFPKVIMGSVAL